MAQQRAPQVDGLRREDVRTPDEVAAMLRLHALGWGTRRIAAEFGCSRNTVKRYLERGGWAPLAVASRPRTLDGLENWLAERFRRHRGNADVVRQELLAERGISISLRTVERAVEHLRRELAAEARATVRFETPPGRQMQIDFGGVSVVIGGRAIRVFLFVATLGHSRRIFVQAFRHERQTAWLDGIEGAFRHFGGLPAEILLDNARALVAHHDAQTREVVFNERLHTFARYWGVRPRACAPYRARTKGKDERGVGYVKRNAIAGRSFASWAALEAHLAWWMREVADRRIHGTTGEPPLTLGLLRQAVYGRLAGYEDVNDAERLARDPAMRAIVGREGIVQLVASTSQMGRFETEWLATEANLAALTDLSGAWIDRVHRRRPPDGIILDMDSSESPTFGQQEGSAWNGPSAARATTRCSSSTSSATSSAACSGPAMSMVPTTGAPCWCR